MILFFRRVGWIFIATRFCFVVVAQFQWIFISSHTTFVWNTYIVILQMILLWCYMTRGDNISVPCRRHMNYQWWHWIVVDYHTSWYVLFHTMGVFIPSLLSVCWQSVHCLILRLKRDYETILRLSSIKQEVEVIDESQCINARHLKAIDKIYSCTLVWYLTSGRQPSGHTFRS